MSWRRKGGLPPKFVLGFMIILPILMVFIFKNTKEPLHSSQVYVPDSVGGVLYTIKVVLFWQEDVAIMKKQWKSLISAEYPSYLDSKRIDVEVVIDCSGERFQNIEGEQEISRFVGDLKWKYGELRVSRKVKPTFFRKSLLRSWYPLKDDIFLVVLEPDSILSKYWYLYTSSMLEKVKYGKMGLKRNIIGISLFSPIVSFRTLSLIDKEAFKMGFYAGHTVNTVGICLFPDFWREFQDWYQFEGRAGSKMEYLDSIANHSKSSVFWNSFSALYQIYSLHFSENEENLIIYPALSFAHGNYHFKASNDLVRTTNKWSKFRDGILKLDVDTLTVVDINGKVVL